MSVRESLHVHYPVDVEKYVQVLKDDYGAGENTFQPGSYLIDNPPLPFYEPHRMDDKTVAIMSFNYLPLSATLLVALINHPELAPETTKVIWTIEQDVLAEGTLFEFKERLLPGGNDLEEG